MKKLRIMVIKDKGNTHIAIMTEEQREQIVEEKIDIIEHDIPVDCTFLTIENVQDNDPIFVNF